jgi:hypothetical protein
MNEAAITVSIPVKIGGYTGQRDQWEEHTYSMAVSREGANVVLQSAAGSNRARVAFPVSALEAAIKITDEYRG